MKRCPLCDFLYEDDQRSCDMDGIELVSESVALLAPAQVATRRPGGLLMARRRLLLLLLVGLVLAGGAISVYHLSTDRTAAGPVLAATPVPAPTPAPTAAPTPAPTPAPSSDAAETGTAAPPARPSPARPRAARVKEAKPRPESASKKNESKVGSLLKKTGRVLKKPFQF